MQAVRRRFSSTTRQSRAVPSSLAVATRLPSGTELDREDLQLVAHPHDLAPAANLPDAPGTIHAGRGQIAAIRANARVVTPCWWRNVATSRLVAISHTRAAPSTPPVAR